MTFIQRAASSLDLFQDIEGASRPDDGFGILVVTVDVTAGAIKSSSRPRNTPRRNWVWPSHLDLYRKRSEQAVLSRVGAACTAAASRCNCNTKHQECNPWHLGLQYCSLLVISSRTSKTAEMPLDDKKMWLVDEHVLDEQLCASSRESGP